MDYKFLNRVIDQIVSETKLDYDKEKIYFPFSLYPAHLQYTILHSPSLYSSFFEHCKNVYTLNGDYNVIRWDDDEIYYVWEKYKEIIGKKIKNR